MTPISGLRWLTAALGTAHRGAGVLLAVEGAAGTGKSRLLQEARLRAHRVGGGPRRPRATAGRARPALARRALDDGAGELLTALAVLGDDASVAAANALTGRDADRIADLCGDPQDGSTLANDAELH